MSVYAFGPFRLDARARTLHRGDRELELPRRAAAILELLLERPGDLVSKQTLLEGAWGETAVSAASLTEAMSLLRQTLGDEAQKPTYIRTVHGQGYRFIAPVEIKARAPDVPSQARRFNIAVFSAAPGAVLLVLFGALLFALMSGRLPSRRAQPELRAPVRFTIEAPPGYIFERHVAPLAISPNGQDLVYAARRTAGPDSTEEQGQLGWKLFHRSLQGFDARAIPGTDNALVPFFSPDGGRIGFFSDKALKTVTLETDGAPSKGPVFTVCPTHFSMGGTWLGDGTLVFAPDSARGLRRVSAGGGPVEILTVPDQTAGELGHWWPEALPGCDPERSCGVIFTLGSASLSSSRIAVLRLPEGEIVTLIEGGGAARYASTGHLVYVRPGSLAVAAFDAQRFEVTGPSIPVQEPVSTEVFEGIPDFALSRQGTLVYLPSSGGPNEKTVKVLRGNVETGLELPARTYRNLTLSPDGQSLAVTIFNGRRSDVWIAEISSGSLRQLTFEGYNIEPVWSPDGKAVFFSSDRDGVFRTYRQSLDGAIAQPLTASAASRFPSGMTPDGKRLLFWAQRPETGRDIGTLEWNGETWQESWRLRTPNDEAYASVSPDGRWLLYGSNLTGDWEIFLEPWEGGGERRRLTTEGGLLPHWDRSGRRVIYTSQDGIDAVEIDGQTGFPIAAPSRVWEGARMLTPGAGDDIFIIRGSEARAPPLAVRVVLNWFEPHRPELP